MSGTHWHLSVFSSAIWLLQLWSFAKVVTHPCVLFGFGGSCLELEPQAWQVENCQLAGGAEQLRP